MTKNIRSLIDIKFDSVDQTGLVLIGDTLQIHGLFEKAYRHSFYRGLVSCQWAWIWYRQVN
jgi:hypothetical protein